jgi:alkanesulfonate monooxygenase SsuD/methylene tetrahydromethanopterin reductase-like flavin-dependent oxidoreductase (luciferase family)
VETATLGDVDQVERVGEGLLLGHAGGAFELVKNPELHGESTILPILSSVKAGVGIDRELGLTREQQAELVKEAARLGFQSLWMPGQITVRSIFQTCRDWWEATREVVPEGLSVGTSVIPFPGWSAPTLAAESASLNEICGGKFSLGIGLGAYPSPQMIAQLGLPTVSPIAYSREYLTALTGLFQGESVTMEGQGVHLKGVQLGFKAPPVPVYLAAMGQQMLRLAGQCANGVTPNWCSAEQVAWMRPYIAEGARKAGRSPAEVPFALYIRVCIDQDEEAARRTFAGNMLRYAMARPGQSRTAGYRGHFGRMGFEDVLQDLEKRRDEGTPMAELVDRVPPELLRKVGYFGKPEGAAAALRELASDLEEAMVRLISVRSGDLDACVSAIRACEPSGWAAA